MDSTKDFNSISCFKNIESQIKNCIGCQVENIKKLFQNFSYLKKIWNLESRDLDFLKPNQMLNDSIINFYIKILDKSYNYQNYYIFSTYFISILYNSNLQNILKNLNKINNKNIKFLIIPYHKKNHWCLLLWNNPLFYSNIIIYKFDSFEIKDINNSIKNDIIKFFEILNENFTININNIKFINFKTPVQKFENECGYYLLEIIKLILIKRKSIINKKSLINILDFNIGEKVRKQIIFEIKLLIMSNLNFN